MPAFFSALSLKTMGWLLVVLLITTFSFGALSVLMYQRQTEIKRDLKDTKKELKQQKEETSEQEAKFNSCLGSIAQINKGISDNALAAARSEKSAQTLASSTMANLPTMIKKDRDTGQQPTAATAWVRDLFQ